MTRTAPATVSDIELWRHQTHMTRDVVGANLTGLTHEDSLIQPHPGGNCLNWVLGHLLSVYNGILPLLNQEPVLGEEAFKRYERGAPPIRDRAEALEFPTLMHAWSEAVERVDTGLAGLTPDVLERPIPDSPSGDPDETVRSLLTVIMFHQAYHAGQTALLRRIAGKEGAIR